MNELFSNGNYKLDKSDKRLSHDPADAKWDYWRGIGICIMQMHFAG